MGNELVRPDPEMDLGLSDAISDFVRQTENNDEAFMSSICSFDNDDGAVTISDEEQQKEQKTTTDDILNQEECSILKEDDQLPCAAELTSTVDSDHQLEEDAEANQRTTSSCCEVPKPIILDDLDEDSPKKEYSTEAMKQLRFPHKMHILLSNPEFENIICWLPHGRSWKIIDPKEFEKQVLPQYFLHTSFSSFTRQVNGWGFRRVTINQYYHEMFLRGMPHVSKKMKRLNKKSMQKRREEGPLAPPGFHKFCIENPILNGITNNILLKQKKEKKTGTIGKMTSAGIVKQNKKIEYSLEDIKRAKIIAKRKKEFQAFKQRHQEALQVKSK